MDCLFCGKACEKIQKTDGEKKWPIKWQCCHHPHIVTYWVYVSDGRSYNLRYDFYTHYKGNIYRWYFGIDEDSPYPKNDFILDNTSVSYSLRSVLRLNYLPRHITPENALHKLPTLLLFS